MNLARVQKQWRIQKFVLEGGGGRSGNLGAVNPAIESSLRVWGRNI